MFKYVKRMNVFQDISHFGKTRDYFPMLNACLFSDTVVLALLRHRMFSSQALEEWYRAYTLGAVTLDISILMIGLVLARFVYTWGGWSFSLLAFTSLAVLVQVIHDFLFYLFFLLCHGEKATFWIHLNGMPKHREFGRSLRIQ
jgi:hypothetical protein